MKRAAVIVSFGTSVEEARQRDIAPVEAALRGCTGLPCPTAYTSPTIRKILAERGTIVPDLAGALEALAAEGVEAVAVQPTHLLYGFEYDGIQKTVEEKKGLFAALYLGRPLLGGTEDVQALAAVLAGLCPGEPGTAHIFLGHGTEHSANRVYPALQTALEHMGRPDILVGTVEGWPGCDEVRKALKARQAKAVRLAPLMLVAGDHALHDMAGEDAGSWKSRLEADGCRVDCLLRGLGSLPQVQALYAAHFGALLRAMEADNGI